MSPENKISAVIITKNEERNIARCIDSLYGIADEIIVVDSYSEDNTGKICKDRNVKIVETRWMGYSDTKNYGNSLAAYPFILSIDADEELSPLLRDEILKHKMSGFTFDAYKFKRLTNYCGKWIRHSGWYPDWKLRLWKKDMGRWEGFIHEEVKTYSKATTGKFRNDILHYSYNSINEHFQQMLRFTDLMARDNLLKNKTPGILKLVFSPLVKFLKSYIIQRGFLDGYYGFVVCVFSAMATFIKYAKTIQLIQMQNED